MVFLNDADVAKIVIVLGINLITVAFGMGKLSKKIDANYQLVDQRIQASDKLTSVNVANLTKTQDDIRDTLTELNKTNARMGSELDRLIGQLSNGG